VDVATRNRWEAERNAARVGAAKAIGSSPEKRDAAARQDRQAVDKLLSTVDRNTNLNKLGTAWDQINAAEANVNSNEPLAHKDATLQLARAVRGQVTEGEMHTLYSRLGGVVDKPQQWLAAFESGDLSGYQQDQVKAAIGIVKQHMQEQIDKRYQAYRQLASDPALVNMAPSVNAAVRSRFATFGREVPNVMDEKTAKAAPVLGGGRAEAVAPGSPEDVNSEAPLPEDPNADELPAPEKLRAAARSEKAKNTVRANSLTRKVTREQAIEEARRRGLIP
jgi:hypothetical protein